MDLGSTAYRGFPPLPSQAFQRRLRRSDHRPVWPARRRTHAAHLRRRHRFRRTDDVRHIGCDALIIGIDKTTDDSPPNSGLGIFEIRKQRLSNGQIIGRFERIDGSPTNRPVIMLERVEQQRLRLRPRSLFMMTSITSMTTPGFGSRNRSAHRIKRGRTLPAQ